MRRKITCIWLMLSALVLEAVCWYAFFRPAAPAVQQGRFVLLHAAGSIAGGAWMALVLPQRYRHAYGRSFLLFFAFCLFLPGLGLAGLVLAVWPAMRLGQRQKPNDYHHIDVPELPYKPLNVQQQPIYGQAGMISVLRHAQDPDRRIKALIATRQMTSQEAIPVLKEALRDPVDDVRLLAYSMLDAKEEEINATIGDLLKRLENGAESRQPLLHQRISNCYWELAYLGLAQGDVLQHALTRALAHLDHALQAGAGEPALHIQRGRLLMHQRRWDEAARAFADAVARGMPETGVAPFLAEIAFEKRDFQEVAAHIRQLGPSVRKSERLAAAAAYWT